MRTFVCLSVCIDAYMYTCVYVCVRVHTYMYIYVCVYICIYRLSHCLYSFSSSSSKDKLQDLLGQVNELKLQLKDKDHAIESAKHEIAQKEVELNNARQKEQGIYIEAHITRTYAYIYS